MRDFRCARLVAGLTRTRRIGWGTGRGLPCRPWPLRARVARCRWDWWVQLRSHSDLPICHDCLAGLNGQRVGQMQLMTGTWLATGFEPIFGVADIASLGCRGERRRDLTCSASRWTRMRSPTGVGTSRFTLLTLPGAKPPVHGALYIPLSRCRPRVAEEWRQAGIEVDGPWDEDYGKREGSVQRPRTGISFGSVHPIR